MSVKQNITLAIETGLLKQTRALAARRNLSVSALLRDQLRKLVSTDRAYQCARRRARALLKTGYTLK